MRHRVAHRKLGRVTEHRIALLRNQATALLRHERIETTVPKAKELRPFVERSSPSPSAAWPPAKATTRGSRRGGWSRVDIQDRDVVAKLFDMLAPRFAVAAGRLHAHAAARLPARRRRRGGADGARRQRVRSERGGREDGRRPGKPAEEERGPSPQGGRQRMRGKKGDDGEKKPTRRPPRAIRRSRRPARLGDRRQRHLWDRTSVLSFSTGGPNFSSANSGRGDQRSSRPSCFCPPRSDRVTERRARHLPVGRRDSQASSASGGPTA